MARRSLSRPWPTKSSRVGGRSALEPNPLSSSGSAHGETRRSMPMLLTPPPPTGSLLEVFHDDVFDRLQLGLVFQQFGDRAGCFWAPNAHLDQEIDGQPLQLVVGGWRLGLGRLFEADERRYLLP